MLLLLNRAKNLDDAEKTPQFVYEKGLGYGKEGCLDENNLQPEKMVDIFLANLVSVSHSSGSVLALCKRFGAEVFSEKGCLSEGRFICQRRCVALWCQRLVQCGL